MRWIIAIRPWSLPASSMPVIVTLLFLHWKGYDVNVGMGLWALVTIMFFQAAGNSWSDYFDYKKVLTPPTPTVQKH